MSSRIITPPEGPIDAMVRVPGSKSVANRALVCAMLADGESVISGLPDGDDTAVIVNVLSEVGRLHRLTDDVVAVSGDRRGGLPGIVDAALAGTSSRFLTAVAALSDDTSIIDGGEPLRGRPMNDLHDALVSLGANIVPLGAQGHLPVSVSKGRCEGGAVTIRGDVSSQFISALMLIAPVLSRGLVIHIEGELVSRSYVEMTAAVMSSFGSTVTIKFDTISIEPTGYVANNYIVEPDYSSAAFPIAALLIRGGTLRIPSLALSKMQGDAAMADIATAMGAVVAAEGEDVVFRRDEDEPLKPLVMNMKDCSDLVPAVVAACLVANGVSEISGVGFIRKKESDRLGDLSNELVKAGANIRVDADGLTITGVERLVPAVFDTHHDHRLAMALSLVSLVTKSVEVIDEEVVSKSWPHYFGDMLSILG